MRVERITMVCDACQREAIFDDAPAAPWSEVTVLVGGVLEQRDVCPTCVWSLLDPPEDFTTELVRFSRL